jgi:hypothetical protein
MCCSTFTLQRSRSSVLALALARCSVDWVAKEKSVAGVRDNAWRVQEVYDSLDPDRKRLTDEEWQAMVDEGRF